MTRVVVGNVAKSDLRDIRIYSKAQFGGSVAVAYLRGLNAIFALLRSRPTIGAI